MERISSNWKIVGKLIASTIAVIERSLAEATSPGV